MPAWNSSRFRRPLKIVTILATGVFLVTMFQNFQPIPLKNLKPEFASANAHLVSTTDGTGDIRRIAPYRPPTSDESLIAQPQSGTDMNSIGQDWLTRQAHLLTGGADERFLADVNRKVNRMMFKFVPLDEAYPDADVSDDDGAAPVDSGNGGGRRPASVQESDDSYGMAPTSMSFIAINHVQVGLKNKTKLSCAVDGGGMRLNVSRPINKNVDFNIQHETARSKSMLQLNYNW